MCLDILLFGHSHHFFRILNGAFLYKKKKKKNLNVDYDEIVHANRYYAKKNFLYFFPVNTHAYRLTEVCAIPNPKKIWMEIDEFLSADKYYMLKEGFLLGGDSLCLRS